MTGWPWSRDSVSYRAADYNWSSSVTQGGISDFDRFLRRPDYGVALPSQLRTVQNHLYTGCSLNTGHVSLRVKSTS